MEDSNGRSLHKMALFLFPLYLELYQEGNNIKMLIIFNTGIRGEF